MRKILILLFITFLFISCENSTEPVERSLADKKSEIVYKILEETVTDHNVPGAALLIKFEDGSILKQVFGYASIQSNNKEVMEPTKLFRIGSVTKTFIGTSVLVLAKQGKLNLTDNIETLLPGVLKYGNEITIEMLLDQSSSIMDYTKTEEFGNIYINEPTYDWSRESILNIFKSEELLDTPGKISYYSNSNYYLLGIIIEKLSGKPLDTFLKDEIFIPLGMYNTYMPTGNDLHGNYCRGYFDVNQDGVFTEDEDYTSQSPNAIWAAGSIVSTLDDLHIWIEELLTGSLLNEELQSKRLTIDKSMANVPEGGYYGLGIADLFGAVGHNGAVAGYNTILFKYKNTTFVAFGNGYETVGENGFIAEDLFENLKTTLFE